MTKESLKEVESDQEDDERQAKQTTEQWETYEEPGLKLCKSIICDIIHHLCIFCATSNFIMKALLWFLATINLLQICNDFYLLLAMGERFQDEKTIFKIYKWNQPRKILAFIGWNLELDYINIYYY